MNFAEQNAIEKYVNIEQFRPGHTPKDLVRDIDSRGATIGQGGAQASQSAWGEDAGVELCKRALF